MGEGEMRTISEIFSPPRVIAAAMLLPQHGVLPGFALDLSGFDDDGRRWDFAQADMRQRARDKLDRDEPGLVVGSPPCTKRSPWAQVNDKIRDPETVRREKVEADLHLAFMAEIYETQARAGRYFLHEHPATATSWETPPLRCVLAMQGTETVIGDQCMYGQTALGGEPVRKRTRWMSNSKLILAELGHRCAGKAGRCSRDGGRAWHLRARGRVARDAAIYPFKLCEAIIRGFSRQLQEDGHLVSAVSASGQGALVLPLSRGLASVFWVDVLRRHKLRRIG